MCNKSALVVLGIMFGTVVLSSPLVAGGQESKSSLCQLANDEMLDMFFCPAGDHEEIIFFWITNEDGTMNTNANPRLSLFNYYQSTPTAVFCDGTYPWHSEYYFPSEQSANGRYDWYISPPGGVDLANPGNTLAILVEWGTNFEYSHVEPYVRPASIDLNGDLIHSNTDVVLFMTEKNSTDPDPRVDFNHDGVIDLTDVSILATHLNHICE